MLLWPKAKELLSLKANGCAHLLHLDISDKFIRNLENVKRKFIRRTCGDGLLQNITSSGKVPMK